MKRNVLKRLTPLLLMALAMAGLLSLTDPPRASALPAWTPVLEYAHAVTWLRADAGAYKDAAKTLPCTAAGDPVAAWADASGNGLDATQSTSASQPVFTPASLNGLPGISFNGTSSLLSLGNGTAVNALATGQGYSVYLVARSPAAGGSFQAVLAKGATGQQRIALLYTVSGGQDTFQDLTTTNISDVARPGGTVQVLSYLCANNGTGAATQSLRSNGTYKLPAGNGGGGTGALPGVTGAVTAPDTTNPLTVGGYSGNYFFSGTLYELLILDHAATVAENQAIEGYLGAKWGLSVPVNIVFGVNSLTAGYGIPAAANTYPSQCMAALNQPSWTWTNAGISGQLGLHDLYFAPQYDDAFFNPLAAQNVYVVWETTNDLATGGATPTAAYQNTVARCQAIRANGGKVILLTCLPRGTEATVPTFEARRQAANALHRADFSRIGATLTYANSPYADLLYDIGSDPAVGVAGAQSNTTYYQSDLTHVNAAGAGVVANGVAAAIRSLTAPAAAPAAPAAPRDSVHLTWPAVPGASAYNVYRDGALLASGVLLPSYVDTAAGAAAHSYAVSSVNALGETAPSAATAATVSSSATIRRRIN